MNNSEIVPAITIVNPALVFGNEVRIVASNYNPEFSEVGGPVARVEKRSGTNSLHCSASKFLHKNVLNSRDPFTQGLHAPGPPGRIIVASQLCI